MGNRKNRILISLLLVVLMVCVGCGKEKEDESSVPVVYHFGGNEITYGEYYIYAKTVEEDYSKAYGNGVWNLVLTVDNESTTVRDVTIEDIIEDINRVKVLAAHAEDFSIVLSDVENAEVENKAEAFYNGLTDNDIEKTGLTKELIRLVISENMLAEKVYDQVLADYDFEISDEEARMITFYDMVFECYELEKDGSVKEFTQEKKDLQLERANEALSSLAEEEGTTFRSIVDKYHLQYSSEYTMSKAELVKEYGNSVANSILDLDDGEVSVVIETQYGYHLFKMLKSNNEELTKENKQQIITSKQKEYFNGVYEDWLKDYDSHFNPDKDVDMKLAGKFPFEDEESEE